MRVFVILSIFLGGVILSSSAHATGTDTPFFALNPSIVGATKRYVWPSEYDTNGQYPKNIYFDFNQNPFLSGDPNEVNYNLAGNVISTSGPDIVTKTGDIKSFPSTSHLGMIGVDDHHQSGTATFAFNTSNLTNNTLYIWAEINVSTTGGSNNYLTFSGLTNVKSSEIFSSTGTLLDKDSSGLFSYDMTGSNTTYDAYFAIKNPGNTEDLGLTFNTGNGTAFANSLHIAMTPEPVSMALFAVGVAVLFLRRRRNYFPNKYSLS